LVLRAAHAYWVPPTLLTDPPPAYRDLAAYAHRGAWTANPYGPVRGLGVAWHRAVSLPVTLVCRYVEWVAQRPARALVVFGLWKLLILTGPGPWLADHIVRPVAAAAAWVLL